jgi:hypothetical protein
MQELFFARQGETQSNPCQINDRRRHGGVLICSPYLLFNAWRRFMPERFKHTCGRKKTDQEKNKRFLTFFRRWRIEGRTLSPHQHALAKAERQ